MGGQSPRNDGSAPALASPIGNRQSSRRCGSVPRPYIARAFTPPARDYFRREASLFWTVVVDQRRLDELDGRDPVPVGDAFDGINGQVSGDPLDRLGGQLNRCVELLFDLKVPNQSIEVPGRTVILYTADRTNEIELPGILFAITIP